MAPQAKAARSRSSAPQNHANSTRSTQRAQQRFASIVAVATPPEQSITETEDDDDGAGASGVHRTLLPSLSLSVLGSTPAEGVALDVAALAPDPTASTPAASTTATAPQMAVANEAVPPRPTHVSPIAASSTGLSAPPVRRPSRLPLQATSESDSAPEFDLLPPGPPANAAPRSADESFATAARAATVPSPTSALAQANAVGPTDGSGRAPTNEINAACSGDQATSPRARSNGMTAAEREREQPRRSKTRSSAPPRTSVADGVPRRVATLGDGQASSGTNTTPGGGASPPAAARPPRAASEVPLDPDRVRGAKNGDVIGQRYTVDGQLGRGGMGRVLQVRHAVLGKPFALKLIKAPIATNPAIRDLFYREARLASAMNHENICSIVDFGEDEAFGLFMVMELLNGQTARQRIRQKGALPIKAACDVMWQVGNAVRYIHARSVVHGDLKSENLFLVRGSQNQRVVKLLDFGLARPNARYGGHVDGTPEYIAPERIAGAPATPASDIYALGVLFFELLTGHLPFAGTVEEIFAGHVERAMPSLSTAGLGDVDARVDQIIARATAKSPTDRHPDIASLLYEIRTLMNMLGMDVSRRRATPVTTSASRDNARPEHRERAEAEVFEHAPVPLACADPSGRIRVANPAFLEFIGAAGNAGGIELRDTGLVDVCPTLLADLRTVAKSREMQKRVIHLSEGGGRVVEAVLVLTPARRNATVTAGEVHILLHPLRALSR